ncbi:hypothetical protein C8J57DRAFT_1242879 [Mycena rebaudengoi]|nr:hypothetical protein C8J57DRAFT_1242879 [Mycena rebaudengoi]
MLAGLQTARNVNGRFQAQISAAKMSKFRQDCTGEEERQEGKRETKHIAWLGFRVGESALDSTLQASKTDRVVEEKKEDGRFDPSTATIGLLSHHDASRRRMGMGGVGMGAESRESRTYLSGHPGSGGTSVGIWHGLSSAPLAPKLLGWAISGPNRITLGIIRVNWSTDYAGRVGDASTLKEKLDQKVEPAGGEFLWRHLWGIDLSGLNPLNLTVHS